MCFEFECKFKYTFAMVKPVGTRPEFSGARNKDARLHYKLAFSANDLQNM